MVLNIEQDYLRFRQIVRGKIKQDLKKYISQGELIDKKGKDFVSIPIPQIEMPSVRFGRRNTGGGGQGEGEPGTALSPGDVDEDGKDGGEGEFFYRNAKCPSVSKNAMIERACSLPQSERHKFPIDAIMTPSKRKRSQI